MSIPLDRLYHYIEGIANQVHGDTVIYRFFPHGSKKLENLQLLHNLGIVDEITNPHLICHDQEPLNFESYQNCIVSNYVTDLLLKYNCCQNENLKKPSIFDRSILLHSEKRSLEVDKYQAIGFIPVYYWSHAIIAQDWFRFAQHVQQQKHTQKTFLIYNRAWAGTREYRLRFTEFLIRLGLQDHCQTTVNSIEPELGIHYETHQFKNPAWRPGCVLENFFPTSNAQSHYSADFDIEDYEATDIEVVLETLFDDDRLHLTEKSLRPIACGQPFILAGTHGSLEYLRSYGFKTFGHMWDERYDLIKDPEERLIRIADLMRQIANWTPKVRERKMAQAQAIADYNKKHFFSKEFFNLINGELSTNLKTGLQQLISTNTSQHWLSRRKKLCTHNEIKDLLTGRDSRLYKISEVIKILQTARNYSIRSLTQNTQI